jgi:hypothetical protein
LGSGKGEKYVKCLNHQYKISSLGILPLSLVSGCWAGHSIYRMDETGMVALVKQYGKTRVSNTLSEPPAI